MRRHLAGIVLVLVLACGSAAVGLATTTSWWRGETDLAGDRVYRPAHLVDPGLLDTVDLARVHGELWPAWIVAESAGQGDEPFARLRAAVSDPNLVELLDDIRRFTRDPVERSDGLLHRAWAWNRYLEEHDQPWRIALGVRVSREGAIVYVKTYEVLTDTRAQVGDETFRARVLARADGTNVVETWLGTTRDHEEGALVVLDRLADFTLDKVWPLLDPSLDRRQPPTARAFGPAIRSAVARALDPAQVAVLERTAADRFALNEAVDGVHGRHLCGSRFVIGALPFDGLAPDDLRTLERFAAGTAGSPCPDITSEEAVIFRMRSEHLREQAGLREALEALLAWTTRAIVVHEARHAADDRLDPPAPFCEGCPADLPPVGVNELSAYLASFAHPEHGALALYQACGVEPEPFPVRAEVVSWLATKLRTGCDAPPPADLAERARRLEREVFGRDEPITLPPDFPATLPLQ